MSEKQRTMFGPIEVDLLPEGGIERADEGDAPVTHDEVMRLFDAIETRSFEWADWEVNVYPAPQVQVGCATLTVEQIRSFRDEYHQWCVDQGVLDPLDL